MTKYQCPRCRATLRDHDQFCATCGLDLENHQVTVDQAQAQLAQAQVELDNGLKAASIGSKLVLAGYIMVAIPLVLCILGFLYVVLTI